MGQDSAAASNNVAAENNTENTEPDLSIPDLSKRITDSLVTVRVTGRDGRLAGHGTGFVVSQDGLIATARHVVGDRRMVKVELADGTLAEATHVYAASGTVDIVILKVDPAKLKGMTPLPLRDTPATTGQSVVTVGHPGNLKNSTFSGILSGFVDIDGINMLQLSMTIERGSSGEPVVDRQGRVIGVVTLKSPDVTNLGFAVPVSHLKQLLEDATPVPMQRWMTIGALDSKRWQTVFGANWSQRAGRISVDGQGTSFGGRALCLQVAEAPKLPYDIQLDVKLNDETGAAGLIFHADGGDRHYGFYPSNGNIRLTRFNGPDVGSWTILFNEPHPAYRPDEWNTYRVRLAENGFSCFLNDQLVVKSGDDRLPPGRVGQATFRGTSAEFRRLKVADELPTLQPDATEVANINQILESITERRPPLPETVERMRPYRRFASSVLQQEAVRLEQRAGRLRQLASDVHAAAVRKKLLKSLQLPASTDDGEKAKDATNQPDLLRAALLIAVLDNDDVEPQVYLDRVDQLADEVRETCDPDASETERLQAMENLLFSEYGFRGSRFDYNTKSNSYLNEVIDDREGLPITLSVVYMEIAKRLDLKVVGIGLPGHYVVRFEPSDGKAAYIDVFNRGERMTQEEAEAIVKARGYPQLPEFFEAQSAQKIVQRMLINLLNLAETERDNERVLRYLETLVAMEPTNLEFRAKRLEIRARTGRLLEAIADADWFIEQRKEDGDVDRLYELRADLQRQLDSSGDGEVP